MANGPGWRRPATIRPAVHVTRLAFRSPCAATEDRASADGCRSRGRVEQAPIQHDEAHGIRVPDGRRAGSDRARRGRRLANLERVKLLVESEVAPMMVAHRRASIGAMFPMSLSGARHRRIRGRRQALLARLNSTWHLVLWGQRASMMAVSRTVAWISISPASTGVDAASAAAAAPMRIIGTGLGISCPPCSSIV